MADIQSAAAEIRRGNKKKEEETAVVKNLSTIQHNLSSGKQIQLECGPMPNVMAALPNTGGTLCSTPQSLADADYQNAVQ